MSNISPYIIVFCLLVLAVAISRNEKYAKVTFICSAVMLTAFLVFRYGQGTDWFGYRGIYRNSPSEIDLTSDYYTGSTHSEPLWKFFNNVVKATGLDYYGFTVIVSLASMMLIVRCIMKYSQAKTLSLLLMFPTIYLTYFFSGLREGLVIAIFLGIMLDLIFEKKWFKFIIMVIIVANVHKAAWVFLVVPFVDRIKLDNFKFIIVCAFLAGLTGYFWMNKAFALFGISYRISSISPIALLYRVVMAFLVYFIYKEHKELHSNAKYLILLKLYCVGLTLYGILMSSPLTSSRVAILFLALDIILIVPATEWHKATQLVRSKKMLFIIMTVIVVMSGVMTVKNISSYLTQGSYYEDISTIHYPYVTVFNKDDIYKYRFYTQGFKD